MKVKILLFFVFAISFALPKDKLKSQVERSFQITQSYYDYPSDTLVYHANYVLKHSKDEFQIGQTYHHLGNIYLLREDYEKAMYYLKKENSYFKKLLENNNDNKYQDQYANSFAAMAVLMSQKSKYAEALQYDFKAKSIYEKTNNLEKIVAINNNIAIEYQSFGKFQIANSYLLKAIEINKKIKQPNGILYSNVGRNYIEMNDLKQSKIYLDLALLDIDREEDVLSKGDLYNNLSSYFLAIGDQENSLKYIQLADAFFTKNDSEFGLSNTYFYYGDYFIAQKKDNQALGYFQKSLEICKSMQLTDLETKLHQKLADIYERKADFKNAMLHQKKCTILTDSIAKFKTEKEIAYTEMMAKMEKNIFYQIENDEKRQRNYFTYFLIFLICIMAFVFLIYKKQHNLQKQNLRLEAEKAELHHQSLLLQMNPHFIFNCLGSISSFILQKENTIALTYLNNFSRLMRITLENSKEKLITIEKEIECLTQYFELEKLRYENIFQYSITKSDAVEDFLKMPTMIIQPMVENAIIHGIMNRKDGKINVNFDIENDNLVCTITDNGIGYFTSKRMKEGSVLSHKSIAIDILKSRIEAYNGTLHIDEIQTNNIVEGTQIKLTLKLT